MILFTRKMHRSLFYLLVVLLALNFSQASSMVQKSQQNDRSSLQQKTEKNISEPNEQKICDGNRFQFLSSYALRKQNDLTKAFDQIKKSFSLTNITYSDRIGRQYKIYEFVPQFQYFESKQVATIKSMNVLNISGGTVRLKYKFKWQKKQIDSFIEGNGTGVVTSDAVSYEKVLQTNETHQLQWNYKKANPITITNSLTLNTLAPYKQFDYAIINQMLNQLKDNKTTVKMELIKSMNKNFEGILKEIVRQDDPGVSIPKQIQYRYNDYRGEYVAVFDNILLENTLASNGLSLIFSQAIRDDKSFQCGEKVPDEPESTTKYGGTQQYISHKLFKSSLKNALVRHSLDSTLSQDNWQSRAFQFFVGDLHDAITTTRNISSYKEIEGLCQAIDDKTFIFEKKSITSFAVTVNFTCYLQQNSTRIVDLILPVEYEITPTVTFKQLNFAIKNIKATPKFIQNPKYKITNPDLAAFMLTQTINAALKSKVIGSGFPVNARKSPQLQVRDGYLFLYDKSTINRFEQL